MSQTPQLREVGESGGRKEAACRGRVAHPSGRLAVSPVPRGAQNWAKKSQMVWAEFGATMWLPLNSHQVTG